ANDYVCSSRIVLFALQLGGDGVARRVNDVVSRRIKRVLRAVDVEQGAPVRRGAGKIQAVDRQRFEIGVVVERDGILLEVSAHRDIGQDRDADGAGTREMQIVHALRFDRVGRRRARGTRAAGEGGTGDAEIALVTPELDRRALVRGMRRAVHAERALYDSDL